MSGLLLLAQDAIDPTAIGDKLGKAQDVQQVLGIIVGVLVLVVLALVAFYLRERKAWGIEKVELVKVGAKAEKELLSRWHEARVAWEQERLRHAQEVAGVREKAADVERGLMREMLDLALRIDKSLTKLAEWKEARE